jgi:hypothetical protein
MNTQTSSRDALIAKLCRMTAIDRIALGFAVAFLFGVAAAAALAYVAIGDAPQGRMWSFLATWAAIGFGAGIVAPWALCRSLHAGVHMARAARTNRAAREHEAAPLAAFFQGRIA